MKTTFLKKGLRHVGLSCVLSAWLATGTCALAHQEAPVPGAQASLFTQALRCYQQNDDACVKKLLSQTVRADRSHPFALLLLGQTYIRQKDIDAARRLFLKGVDLYPKHPKLHNALAVTWVMSEQWSKAGESFLKSAELVRQPLKARHFRLSAAQCFWRAKDLARTDQIVTALIAEADASRAALELAGALYVRQERWQAALEVFERIVIDSPTHIAAWQSLGSLRLRLNQSRPSAVALEVADRLRLAQNQPSAKNVRQTLAGLYARLNAPYLHLASLDLLPEETRTLRQKLAVYQQSGQTQKAIETAGELIKTSDMPILHQILGSLYYRTGDLSQAYRTYLEGGRGQKDVHEQSRFLAGIVAWEMGEREKAREAFKTITVSEELKAQAQNALMTLESMDRLELELTLPMKKLI